jgi:hypothetical protein
MRARLFVASLLGALVAACSNSNSVEVTAPSAVRCDVTVAGASPGAVPASGASGTLTVTTTRDCTWNATSDQAWLTITAGASGQGAGSVAYTVAANPQASQRRATLDVNASRIAIVQDAAACAFTVSPENTSVSAGGGSVTVTVEVLSGCAWTAQSGTSWITASAASGSGNGTVTLQVAANAGDARSGSVTVAGRTITVAQTAAACTFGVTPAHIDVPSGGAAASPVTVTVRSGCSWTAGSGASWIAIASGAAGNGNGTVTLSVAANAGDARTGTVAIAGQTITIAQAAAPCAFTYTSTGLTMPAEGGGGSVTVGVRSGCAWTAASGVPWIAITSAASGSGNGTVTFSVAANQDVARSGTVTVAGRAFTVSQAMVTCTYGIAPAGQQVPGEGGNGNVSVTAPRPCTWTAVSNAPWITVVSGASGSGNGTVGLTIAGTFQAARTGTVTIAGQTYTVAQAEVCSFSLDRPGQIFGAAGGSGSVALTASSPTCGWGVASTADWLAVLSPAAGNTGNGVVQFSVAPNGGPPRLATLIIGLRRFDVLQAGQ